MTTRRLFAGRLIASSRGPVGLPRALLQGLVRRRGKTVSEEKETGEGGYSITPSVWSQSASRVSGIDSLLSLSSLSPLLTLSLSLFFSLFAAEPPLVWGYLKVRHTSTYVCAAIGIHLQRTVTFVRHEEGLSLSLHLFIYLPLLQRVVGPTSITSEKSIADKYALVAARSLDSLYLRPGDATPMHLSLWYVLYRFPKSQIRRAWI